MNVPTDSTILLAINGLFTLTGLFANLALLRKFSEPRPANQDLDKTITRIDTEVIAHERRLTTIETSRVQCHLNHLNELDKLYKISNSAASSATSANEKLDLLIRLTRGNKHHD